MATRRQRKVVAAPARSRARIAVDHGAYFAAGADRDDLEFTSTGCAILDEALGGGPIMGRVINIVGDKSAGKTQVAMETMANTLMRYPNAWARYGESEAAWDAGFARALGLPVDRIILNPKNERVETVEQWYEDIVRLLDEHPDRPGVYVLDSLDAMSDAAEADSDFGKNGYGMTKPKAMGEFFRRLIGRLERQRVLLVVVSQLRDKIGAMFGETKTRSGGKALDYYATQIVWLRELGKMKRTVSGIERVTGIEIEANVKKNKGGMPYRKARYPILFGYGIDDMTSMAEWLVDIGRERELHALGMCRKATRARKRGEAAPDDAAPPGLKPYEDVIEEVRNTGGAVAQQMREQLRAVVRREWARVELDTLPKAAKYGPP